MRGKYDFYSFFVIPALTLLLAAGDGLTGTNFSVIGNREGSRGMFLLWSAAAGNYFYLYGKDLIEYADCRDKLVRTFLSAAFLLFLCGTGLPYLPGKVPVLSRLHVWASFGGPFFLFLCLHRLVWVTEKREGCRMRGQKAFQLAVAAVSAVLYLWVGIVSSLLEMFVTFSTCVCFADLQRRLEKIRLSNH